jgi:hypothetical protein
MTSAVDLANVPHVENNRFNDGVLVLASGQEHVIVRQVKSVFSIFCSFLLED